MLTLIQKLLGSSLTINTQRSAKLVLSSQKLLDGKVIAVVALALERFEPATHLLEIRLFVFHRLLLCR